MEDIEELLAHASDLVQTVKNQRLPIQVRSNGNISNYSISSIN